VSVSVGVASVIALLEKRRFPYTRATKQRIEKLCKTEEIRFGAKIPGMKKNIKAFCACTAAVDEHSRRLRSLVQKGWRSQGDNSGDTGTEVARMETRSVPGLPSAVPSPGGEG
jgi:hypothetical protein